MRLLTATLSAVALLLLSGAAGAYEITFSLKAGSPDPSTLSVGDQFTYEVNLDNTGQPGIVLFSMSVVYDKSVIGYSRPSSSVYYYPLYTPSNGKTAANWLSPKSIPPVRWPSPPSPAQDQVNIDFFNTTFQPTTGTASDAIIGEISFNAVGVGDGALVIGFDNGGNIFNVNGTDESDSVTITVSDPVVTVPEPTTAVVALGALGTLGVLARRRMRS